MSINDVDILKDCIIGYYVSTLLRLSNKIAILIKKD